MIATPTGIARHVASDRRDGTIGGGRDRRVLLIFGVVLLTVAVARALVLASGDAPPGFDGGNWLAFGNAFLGRSVKAASVVYPPLVPALSVAAAEALGPTAGLSVLAGVSSVLPAVGVFVVLSSAGLRAWAFALAVLAAFVPSPGAIASWGGYPQLIATPFALIAYGALEAWLRTRARRALLVFGGAMLVVFATSHYVALVTAIALPMVAVATALDRTVRPQVLRRAAIAAAVAAAAAAPVMLVYARLIPAVLATQGRVNSAAALQVDRVPTVTSAIYGPALPVIAILALATIVALLVGRRSSLWAVVCGATAAATVTFAITREPRVLYELGTLGALGAGALVLRAREASIWPRIMPLVVAMLGTGVAVSAIAGIGDARASRARFAVLDPGAVEALTWLRHRTPSDATVASTSYRGAPIGWWVEGLAERRSRSAIDRELLVFPQERRDAATARRIFGRLGASPTKGLVLARAAGVDYLLIPRRSEAGRALGPELASGDLLPVFQNGRMLVIEVPNPSAT